MTPNPLLISAARSPLSEAGETPVAPVAPSATLEAVAEQFEAIFVAQLLGEMRRATEALRDDRDDAGALGKRDHTTHGLHEWADTQVAQALAARRAFGIADIIIRQMAGR
ncbi:peptidoglycan hydrolase [Pandoraea cepalis]|uniref:Peptidoglycan hydrolase n=1 Tax=Pandoraea cepalis TaxID=2508294 RepID=A0AAW7MMT0_9BURK|nr:peptidoglycan hydrolase [Pandoraea cepalis]MDN4573881.1 peptidoglycan hydrolase [Pandoraea cepalis]MDN4580417.1 peptidoglycan hydrolase [Pandoraea cepalis]